MAVATVSLTTTTFTATVEPGDTKVILASATGITPSTALPQGGTHLYVDRELMLVERFTGIGNEAVVRRGLDGTAISRHATNATVWIGRGDQFYNTTPMGLPPAVLLVYPYIDVRTGVIWVAQGDESGVGNAGRIWAPMTITLSTDALGNQHVVTTTPS